MTKEKLIAAIITASEIHHNISTSRLKLPDEPDGAPDNIFWNTCGDLVNMFVENWQDNPRNDSGNRNLCRCKKVVFTKNDFANPSYHNRAYSDEKQKWYNKKEAQDAGLIEKRSRNIRSDGACKKHDLYHIYSHGVSGATLYWSKYWSESNSKGVYFRGEDDLVEMENGELEIILDDLQAYNQAVAEMLKDFPDELQFRYNEWHENQKEEKRREAMGYNRKLLELINSDNPAIVRLAKGIKKEIVK